MFSGEEIFNRAMRTPCAPRVVLCARKGVLAWSAALRFGGGPLLARVLVHAEVICMIVATVIPVRLGVRQPD